MTRILDRYIFKELGPPFTIGVGVFTFFLVIDVTRYMVQLYSKLAFPLVHVIMALVAIPFALVSPRSGGRATGIGVAIVIAVGSWVVHSVALGFA